MFIKYSEAKIVDGSFFELDNEKLSKFNDKKEKPTKTSDKNKSVKSEK